MEFFLRAAGSPRASALLPGTFNPVTRAHLALARAALGAADEVVFVLPRAFPHKEYEGARFDDRMALLVEAARPEPRFSVAASEGGLFIEIAREARRWYGEGVRLMIACGRDAAERIVGWDYGNGPGIEEQLSEYELLVAARLGEYTPSARLAQRIHRLHLAEEMDEISATEVRRRAAAGEPWRHLVPETVAERIERLYRAAV